ncbi:hypothetical protein [Acidovorax sp. CCYZU-2555]|uniref:hypothetical protein n=1 Tax=Acidovorax sp. CCYZU-2555 TaxID=2835042 RepID=UPI001BCF5216|nr:hypothetical protein [Acidovorax sp. CCYZU-2555]MBS7778813.1 hypothetical protein [Acidovorax sp. CCYZU-2555]
MRGFKDAAMYMRKIGLLAPGFLSRVAGAMKVKSTAAAQPGPSGDSARIRLFGQRSRPAVMFIQSPLGAHTLVKIGNGGLAAILASLVGRGKSAGMGIAQSEHTRSLIQRNRLFSRVDYWEFSIPGGKPVQIENLLSGMKSSEPVSFTGVQLIFHQRNFVRDAVSFIPQAGKDYEVGIHKNGGMCTVMVYEVQTTGSGLRLVPVAVDY